MLHFDDISLFTQEEIEINTGLFLRKIEVRNKETITGIHLSKTLRMFSTLITYFNTDNMVLLS